MQYPLYEHQRKVIELDKKWFGLWYSTGSGKSRTVLELAEGSILCIVPKQQKLDRNFENTAINFSIDKKIHVISKEEFRRDWEELPYFDTVIVDEAHYFTHGVTTDTKTKNRKIVPKSSLMFQALYYYLKKHQPKRFYPCTATPVSKPMNVYALSMLFGNPFNFEFFAFRSKYYIERKKGWRSIWIPRSDKQSQDELTDYIRQMGYVGRLDDWFDVPDQIHETKYVSLTAEQKQEIAKQNIEIADPMVLRAKVRTIENGCLYGVDMMHDGGKIFSMSKETVHIHNEKLEVIEQLCEEFLKILIFANYTAQIDQIATYLAERGYNVLTLTGQTKDRENVISTANGADKVVVIAQCSISAGYELPGFRCTVFASKSFKVVDYLQSLGRTLRLPYLSKNAIIHIVTRGGSDEACHKAILSGQNFIEGVHEKTRSKKNN